MSDERLRATAPRAKHATDGAREPVVEPAPAPLPGRATRTEQLGEAALDPAAARGLLARALAAAAAELVALDAANRAADARASSDAASRLRSALKRADAVLALLRRDADPGLAAAREASRAALAHAFTPSADALREAVAGAGRPRWDREVAAWREARGHAAQKQYLPVQVAVTTPMTRAQFEAAANLQVFGAATVATAVWRHVRDAYTPDDSPVEILVELGLVQQLRGAARGIDTGAAAQLALEPAAARTQLLAEIDRRYHAATGTAPGGTLAPGGASAALWRSIRDEVLFQHVYLTALPARAKALIEASLRDRALRPAEYDQLFRIAKQLEALPPGAAADYASKRTATPPDLAALERGLHDYGAELAARERADAARTRVHDQLLGLHELYKLFRQYSARSILETFHPLIKPAALVAKQIGGKAQTAQDMRDQLEQQLPRHGFATIAAFATAISQFERAFTDGAVRITLDLLAKYRGTLQREAARYRDPAVVAGLYGKLAGFRAQHAEFAAHAKVWNDYAGQHARNAVHGRMPGNGHLHAKPPTADQARAGEQAKASKAAAEISIKQLSVEYPIFAEDELPVDKRLDKAKLARASEAELAGFLQAHLAARTSVVAEARGQVEAKHPLVYRMTRLMPAFYAQLEIRPGSIHDLIIQDRIGDDAIAKLATGVALAVVAVALTVISLGAATPAVVAAGASIGVAGLGAYMAYEEYKQYAADHAIADAGFATEPSLIWLVLAIAGAGVDMAAATKAVRALASAARTLDVGGDAAQFAKAVEALRQSQQLDAKIAAAANRAAAARRSYAAAKGDLAAALGKLYSLPGPFTDPAVYRALVKMAVAKLHEGAHSLTAFIGELQQARLAAKLGDLSPDELVNAKQAWAHAESLAAHVKDAALLERLLSKVSDPAALERLLATFPASELDGIVGALKNADQLVVMVDHLGIENTRKMVRPWIEKSRLDKANQFLERLNAGVPRELMETSSLSTRSVIIDSNTAIALEQDANPLLRAKMGVEDKARVAFIRSLPPDTELRVGNVTVGETGAGVARRGVPLDVSRNSPEYIKVLDRLALAKVGGPRGAADQALVADVFFAKTAPGAATRFVSADQQVINRLAKLAGIDVNKIGGFKVLLSKYSSTGFQVTIEGRSITVIPLP